MKIIKTISLSVLLFTTIIVNGQEHFIGVNGGITRTNVAENVINGKVSPRTGVDFGLSYDYNFHEYFSFSTELLYSQRGSVYEITYTDIVGRPVRKISSPIKYDYLAIPLKLGFQYGETISVFTKIGLMPAILISKTTELDIARKFDVGGLAELGLGYKINKKLKLVSFFTYYNSLNNSNSLISLRSDDDLKEIYKGVRLNIGVAFAL